ncbi:unnamed protein product [Ambrosiozyma monospora]|uniref:Unnamed protein product n=1 Tax=Ambrosiozyma monospora TaxID=43982 RepID=A0ACB5STR9_AMBMO|nr:unnamed protein product [Ambrosiozyma monospora]
MAKPDIDDYERRPNPKGWVQPKAPYNPFDPSDQRPAEGYPSEFNAPSKLKQNTGFVAQDTTDFEKIRVDMKKLKYHPRPPSELYPGRYKVLRKVNVQTPFKRGANITAKGTMWGVVIFGVFFYKWNDHENIFAPFRRFQLKAKELLFGELNIDDFNDLYNYKKDLPIPQKPLPSIMYEKNVEEHLVGEDTKNDEFIKDRFGNKHVVQAEHVKQKEEEGMLRAMDIAERELQIKKLKEELSYTTQIDSSKESKPFWKVW